MRTRSPRERRAAWIARIAGALIITPIFLLQKRGCKISVRWLAPLALIGTLDATAITLLNAAGHTEQPQIAAVAGSAFGVVTIILAWLILKERIAGLRWFGIVITFGGVALLTTLS